MYNIKNNEHIPKRSTELSVGYDIPVSAFPEVKYFIGKLAELNDYENDMLVEDIKLDYEAVYKEGTFTLYPGVVYRFYTGIHLEHGDIKDYQYLMVLPRSSMRKYGLRLLNEVGVIDPDYRGEIQIDVCVEVPLTVNIGDRLCQMIVCESGRIAGEIEPTEVRGEGGFGSTGI